MFLEYGRRVTAAEMVRATQQRMELWHRMRDFHRRYDLLLTPVTSITGYELGKQPTSVGGQSIPPMGWMPFTQPFNLTGQPAASVPCGFDSRGLPVGLQVVGRAYEDALVLRACRAFEQAAPWAHAKPRLASAAAA
jgi:aspartyl-tRNA(Asn)/glutamyl-tRNA(Gln) amidotransferase subunit A